MPTYDYKCDACGHAFEQFQSMTAEPIRKCPRCKKNKVKRLIGTGAGLIFKGSGFYITDYRDASYTEKAKAESGAATGGESKPSEGGSTSSNGDGAAAKPAASSDGGNSPSAEAKPATSTAGKSGSKPVATKKKGK